MILSTPAFENKGEIPAKFTCDGENISPQLAFQEVPEEAKALVLVMEDPDVPASVREDGVWDHWVIFNIPPWAEGVAEGATPPGVQGVNTGGDIGYGGPCPPDGEHRYFFYLYALDAKLDLEEGASKADVHSAMEGRVVAKAELMGRYTRPEEM